MDDPERKGLQVEDDLVFDSPQNFDRYLVVNSDEEGVLVSSTGETVSVFDIAEKWNGFVHYVPTEKHYPGMTSGLVDSYLSKQDKIRAGEVDRKLEIPANLVEYFRKSIKAERLKPIEGRHRIPAERIQE